MLRSLALVALAACARMARTMPAYGDDCSDPSNDDPDCPPPPRLVAAPCFTCGVGDAPRATAVGGTQAVAVVDGEGNPVGGIAAESSGPAIGIEDPAGASFVLAGQALGNATITIVGAQVRLADTLDTATLSSVSLVPSTGESTTGAVAFAAGDRTIGLLTLGRDASGSTSLLADRSLAVTGWPGAVQPTWDSLHGSATVGAYALIVTSGAVQLDIPLVIVDHADSINAEDQPIEPGVDAVLCFDAVTGGRDVVGLAWTFAFASQPAGATLTASGEFPDCVIVFVPAPSSTQVAITATTGGATVTHTYAND
jgi:hypothetical protein